MTYTVYNNNTCTQNPRGAGSLPVDESTGAAPNSSTLSFPTVGAFYWQAVFSGDANILTTSSWSSELLTVGTASPTLTTALNQTSIAAGGTDFDTATLNGFAAPGGELVDGDLHGVQQQHLHAEPPGAGSLPVDESTGAVPNSSTLSFPTVGAFYWQAVFSGDANNNPTTSSCSSEPLTVGTASPTLTTALNQTSIAAAWKYSDTATLNGFAAPGGSSSTVTYTVYSNNTCTQNPRGAGSRWMRAPERCRTRAR